MKRRGIVISIVIVLAIVVFLTFFYQPRCDNITCWNTKLSECDRAIYINNPLDVTWEYKINGEKDGRCEVEVTALQIKRGLRKTEILEGKSMTCFLPLGSTTAPESNPNLCTGKLKEEMQNLIIIKLHEYIIQNVGQISDALSELEGVTSPIDNEVIIEGNETNSSG